MDWTGAPSGEHPNEEDYATQREAHEQIVTVFLDDSIEKPRHF